MRPRRERALGAGVAAAEVHPVRLEPERRLDVVVDHGGHGECPERPPISTSSSVEMPFTRSWITVAPPSTAIRAVSRLSTSACSLN